MGTASGAIKRRTMGGLTWILIWMLGALRTTMVQSTDPCNSHTDDVTEPCRPCPREKWQDMVSGAVGSGELCKDKPSFNKADSCGGKQITESEGCFNYDPLKVKSLEVKQVVSENDPILDKFESSLGFTIPEVPFFRYFLPPPLQPKPNSTNDFGKFDIGQVQEYYIRPESATDKGFYTDFELFEWPGKTTQQHAKFLEEITMNHYGCKGDQFAESDGKQQCLISHEFITLAYFSVQSRFINYPCNSVRGTHVVAYGRAIPVTNRQDEDQELDAIPGEPSQNLYITHGPTSIHREYIQPLKARKVTLEEMMSPDSTTGECLEIKDLRTVLDFAFTTERLIIGTKCGILVVSKLMDKSFIIHAAKVLRPAGATAYFGHGINRISASVCCEGSAECRQSRHIVAAYGFNPDKKYELTEDEADDLTYIYVSFDLGDTFEKKYVAPVDSAINLIRAMYGLYDRYYWYYRFLEPEKEDKILKGTDGKDLFQDYKAFEAWETLNAEEKEGFIKTHSKGGSVFGVEETGKDFLKKLFCNQVEAKLDEDGDESYEDLTPEWVKNIIAERYKPFNVTNWTDCEDIPECEKSFEQDKIINDIFLGHPANVTGTNVECPDGLNWTENTVVYTPKRKPNETFCWQIVSFTVVEEKQNILAVCKVGYCENSDCSTIPSDNDYYAVFELTVQPMIPIAYPRRVSERIFKCNVMKNKMDGLLKDENIEPAIVDIPKSASLLITNCKHVIYFSPNLGRTIFNAVFYFKDLSMPGGTQTTDKYARSYEFEELDVPPAVAVSPNGQTILMTFSNFYAHGAVTYNTEFRFLIGKTFAKPEGKTTAVKSLNEGELVAIPWFTNGGEVTVSLALLGIIGRENEYKEYYKGRQAIRLVDIPISFYKDTVAFFKENLNVKPESYSKLYDFDNCNTYAFSYGPKSASLDLDDTAVIQVSVSDTNPLLPLSVFTNEEESLIIKVKLTSRAKDEINEHDWNVTIRAVANYRPKEISLVDGFFGSEYNNLYEYDTNIVLVNKPTIRCHVQPSGHVNTEIGCLRKILVAHEDEYRPQCKPKFIDFNYTLKAGHYNPDLARYWMETTPNFVRRDESGDLHITYDYATFGCPIEPYSEDPFAPDLRVLTEKNRRHSGLGAKFKGNYILIEVFGAKGFDYKWVNHDVGCTRPPQTSKQMIKDWVIRRRLFNITAGRMISFMGTDEPIGSGSSLFNEAGVNEHLNIWNRVNYVPCTDEINPKDVKAAMKDHDDHDDDDDDDDKPPPLDPKNKTHGLQYEIMNNFKKRLCYNCTNAGIRYSQNEINSINWWSNNRPRVFVFLAVAVDPAGTLCNHFTIFGVSLPKAQEVEDIWSLICFLVFTLLWIILVLMGYWCRKSYIRKAYIEEARSERLKQAAWTVIYRYEKLLHENEHKELETEISDFSKALYQKDREKAYEQMKADQKRLNKNPKGQSRPSAQPPPPKSPAPLAKDKKK